MMELVLWTVVTWKQCIGQSVVMTLIILIGVRVPTHCKADIYL